MNKIIQVQIERKSIIVYIFFQKCISSLFPQGIMSQGAITPKIHQLNLGKIKDKKT